MNIPKIRSVSLLLAIFLLLALFSTEPLQAQEPVANSYIIVFKDTVNPNAAVPAVARAHGLQIGFTYQHALKGMSAVVPAGRLAALENDPRVAYVVEDMVRTINNGHSIPTGIRRIFADSNSNMTIDGADDWRVDVDVAVIDTGVDYQHPDLDVVGGVNCSGGGPFGGNCVDGGDDDHYHGTHVAGTIGGIDNGFGVVGVAPGARIWTVKVLNNRGSGYTSWIVAGIDWVAGKADTIEVANMSLGGSGFNQAEYDAIQGAVNAGVAFAVAAGNSSANANNYSPAAFDNALTVSALADFDGVPGGKGSWTCRSDQDDTLADFSNWGTAVDIAAPGVCILSTFPLEEGDYGTISGTSMASPHVAGALALLASANNPNNATDVGNLYAQITNTGNFNWTDESDDGIQEPLLDISNAAIFNPMLIPGGGSTNSSPTASFSVTSSGLTATFTDQSSDTDGTIISWSWDFGDDDNNNTETAQNPAHTYSVAGTYLVILTVTDNEGATGSTSQNVTVSDNSSGGITLTASGRKVRGVQHVDLSWNGAAGTNLNIYRDDSLVATTANDGDYTDNIGQKGGGSYRYKVCEDNSTTNCSNEATVTF